MHTVRNDGQAALVDAGVLLLTADLTQLYIPCSTLSAGNNEDGQLGTGTYTSSRAPTAVVTNRNFESVSAGGRHTCAVTVESVGYCFGANGNGEHCQLVMPWCSVTSLDSVPCP